MTLTATATTSPRTPVRFADFDSLVEALDYAALGQAGWNFYTARGELTTVIGYAEVRERALALARRLVHAGMPRDSRMVLIADTDPGIMVAFLACQYAGVMPVPVALPTSLGGRAAYVDGLRRQVAGSGAFAAMAPKELLPFLNEACAGLGIPLIGSPEDFAALPEGGAEPRPYRKGDPGYLQYSSGSTRFPLGVIIPQRAIAGNTRAIASDGLRIRAGDRCVSWLPLYHDMGLVGFMLTPLACQMSVDFMTTRDFARRPLTWLSLISRHGGSLSFSPTFGYDLCNRRAGDASTLPLDLATWRAAGIGGDMIQPQVLERFADNFAPYGFRRTAFVPSYGMAETTLAFSFSPLDTGVKLDPIDRRRLTEDGVAVPVPGGDPALVRSFVVCGRALIGHQVEIRDDHGEALPQRRLGRICVRGPSIMDGYFNDDEATRRVLAPDGWLDTGDLGYLLEDEIVITGRSKDLIIINGRNIWPQDLEWAVEEIDGLRRGDAAAFSIDKPRGGEAVVVLVQCRTSAAAGRDELRAKVAAVLQRTAAVEATVVLVPPKMLPQTSSGKLSRSKAKANFLSGIYATDAAATEPMPSKPSA